MTLKIREITYAGLSCACVWDNKAKFFLFADIDSKDPEHLRLIVQEFARNHLDFIVTETRKGYHVVSPNMLPLDVWDNLKNKIKSLLPNYYKFLVIRIDKQRDDKFKMIHFDEQPTYPISGEFLELFNKRFDSTMINVMCDKYAYAKGSILQILTYTHHEIIEENQYRGICCSDPDNPNHICYKDCC